MNEQTKVQVESYAEECRTEQLELLRTLGKMYRAYGVLL